MFLSPDLKNDIRDQNNKGILAECGDIFFVKL